EKGRNRDWFRLAHKQSRRRYEEIAGALSARSLVLYERFFSREKARVDLTGEVLDLHSVLPAERPEHGSGAQSLSPAELAELGYKGFEGGWRVKERSLHSGKLLSHLRARIFEMGGEVAEGEVRLKCQGSRISCA